jgi:hypothetical protein
MFGRIAAAAALIALAGCAGMESAGRNASRSPEPTRVASAPPVQAAAPAPTQTPAPAPVVTAPPAVAAATPAPRTASSAPPVSAAQRATPAPQADRPVTTAARDDEDVVVPGQRERQVQPPNGDPRSNSERMQDIRAWDQCVVRVQSAYDRDPMRPQLDSPEDYCRESLGMADRTSIPLSRLESRR